MILDESRPPKDGVIYVKAADGSPLIQLSSGS
jgi:hypothetical protein